MQRRRFLQSTSGFILAASMSRLWAMPAPAGAPKFILVFLRGAYDATNVLVPYNNDFYYAARPHIAVPRPGSGADAAIALDDQWALHPALRDSMMPMWQSKQLAFVPFAGTSDMSRSHFETQDHIELGQGTQPQDFNEGFLNRLIGQIGAGARPMAFSAQVPLSMRGTRRVPNEAIPQSAHYAGKGGIPPRDQELLAQMWRKTPQEASVREGFAAHAEVMRDLQAQEKDGEMADSGRGAVSPNGFVAEAARVGGLMRDSFNVGFIDVGGWDTHVNEASENGSQGQLANKLGALGDGLAAMSRALGPAWRDTTVVVLSEFGRTFRENGNRGTDHGHGTVYWVMGGAVNGGRIAGEQVVLSPQTLNQNRDYPVLTDYRDLIGAVFLRQWGLNTTQLQAVFPGAVPADLQLL
jgi:uncharacterized protein (DUF1501 family)